MLAKPLKKIITPQLNIKIIYGPIEYLSKIIQWTKSYKTISNLIACYIYIKNRINCFIFNSYAIWLDVGSGIVCNHRIQLWINSFRLKINSKIWISYQIISDPNVGIFGISKIRSKTIKKDCGEESYVFDRIIFDGQCS